MEGVREGRRDGGWEDGEMEGVREGGMEGRWEAGRDGGRIQLLAYTSLFLNVLSSIYCTLDYPAY